MQHLQHLSLTLGAIVSTVTVVLLIAGGFALVGHLRKAVVEAAEQTASVWKNAAEAEKARTTTLQQQLDHIEERFGRMEAEHMIQARQLEMFRRKGEYHDSVIRIVISIKNRIPADALERIEMLLKEMIDYCDKAEIDIISLKQSHLYFDHLRRRTDRTVSSDRQGDSSGGSGGSTVTLTARAEVGEG